MNLVSKIMLRVCVVSDFHATYKDYIFYHTTAVNVNQKLIHVVKVMNWQESHIFVHNNGFLYRVRYFLDIWEAIILFFNIKSLPKELIVLLKCLWTPWGTRTNLIQCSVSQTSNNHTSKEWHGKIKKDRHSKVSAISFILNAVKQVADRLLC